MRRWLIVAFLFVLGVAVNLHFGRRGFLPLDQSIAFDGGWRLLNGQLPFRDFTAPAGIVPSAMQAPFFRLFGVSWFALCLHASVVNGLLCVAVYAFLRLLDATVWEAIGFAALSAFFFYPPTGTPFNDQHSFFFTALMFLAVVAGSSQSEVWRARLAWFLVPALFLLGLLSCQIPTAFGGVCVAVWVALNPRRALGWIGPLAAGAVAVAAVIALLAITTGLDVGSAFAQVISTPLRQGGARTPIPGLLSPVRMVLGTIWRLPLWAHLWSLALAVAAIVVVPFAARRTDRWPLQLWSLMSLIAITGAFVGYSKTQIDTALGLAMLIAGIGWVLIRQAVDAAPVSDPARSRLRVIAAVVVAFAAAVDTVRFVQVVDAPGTVHKKFSGEAAIAAEGRLPQALSFMRWSRGASHYEPDELSALVQYLREADGAFLLIGDSSVLYGLTGKVSPSRALWFDPGLTMPRRESPDFAAFEADLIARVREFGVRRIVLEGPHTWAGVSLNDFPTLKQLAGSMACGERAFGGVRVLEMCSIL
jgi:hypothetical protein